MTDLGGEAPDEPPIGAGPPLAGWPMADLPIVRGGGIPAHGSPGHRCTDTPSLILRALEGVPDPGFVDEVRRDLHPCQPCVDALEVEIRFKIVMAQQATDRAPRSLQLRISETLRRVDLGEIDVTDL